LFLVITQNAGQNYYFFLNKKSNS